MSKLSSVTDMPMESARVKSVNRRIFQALVSLASAALLVRVAGMLNQVVVTARFGAGPTMDAYFVASTIPLLLALLIADAMEVSVIPVYARLRVEGTKEQAARFFSTLLNCLFLGAVLLTLLMLIFRYQLILISAPALGDFRTGVAVDLTPVLFPAFLFMTVIGFLECILNAEGQFGWPAYAGTLVPLSTVVVVLLVSNSLGIVALGVGMLIGLTLQLGVFIMRVKWAGIKYRPVLTVHTPEIRSVLVTAWPVLLAAVVTQALPFADQIVASFLSPGSISSLNYATKLISVPVGVVFGSVGRAALPYLAQQNASNDIPAFKETLRLYLWGCGLLTILLTIFMIIFAHPLVRILFQHGAFSSDDTNRTVAALVGFTIGLTPMAIGFLLAKAFSALGKTKVLMGITLFSVVANTLLDVLFAHFWQAFGIALATSTVYVCTMCIMLLILGRAIGTLSLFTPPPALVKMIRKIGMGL
jgi:murein biosynthesis integral membrane protein MurJ